MSIKNNFINNFQKFFYKNLRNIIIIVLLFTITVIIFQSYNYFAIQDLKKTSTSFFNSINTDDKTLLELNKIKDKSNIFSTLSTLKLIQENNNKKNFTVSNELYKEIIFNKKLDSLYKSSVAVHAAYTLINGSYIENSIKFLEDISIYIENISDELENYYSIKKELEYLLLVTEIDLNKSKYKNNSKVIEIYNSIYDSDKISSSVKERVKKIHEFQIYK